MDVSSAVIRTLDESIRPFLSEGRAWYHSWLSTSTFFVGFGVVLEAPEIFHELYRELSEYLVHRRRQRLSLDTFGFRVPRPGQAHLPRVPIISLIGWLMVAAGVVGEFRFDDKVSEFDATIQMIDNELLAQTGLEAAESRAIQRPEWLSIQRRLHRSIQRGSGAPRIQKRKILLRLSCQTGKCREDVLIRVVENVERNRDGLKLIFLEFQVGFGHGVGAVRVKIDQHHVLHH